MAVVYAALYVYACWLMYVMVIGMYRAYMRGAMHPVVKVLSAPWIVVGLLMDVGLQLLATVFFIDAPRKGEWLLTQRLTRYMDGKDGWRKQAADWICTHLLDLFDPRGDHC